MWCISVHNHVSKSPEKKIITLFQCDGILSSWRSEIGKAGIAVVKDLWKSDKKKYSSKEQRMDYVKDALDGLTYLYKYPSQLVSAIQVHPHVGRPIMMFARLIAGCFGLISYLKFFPSTLRRCYKRSEGMAIRSGVWPWRRLRYVDLCLNASPYITYLHTTRLSGGLRSTRPDKISAKRRHVRTRRSKSDGLAHVRAPFVPMISPISPGDIEHAT